MSEAYQYPETMDGFAQAEIVTLDQLERGDEIAFVYGDSVRVGEVEFVPENLNWVKIVTKRNGHFASFNVEKMQSEVRRIVSVAQLQAGS